MMNNNDDSHKRKPSHNKDVESETDGAKKKKIKIVRKAPTVNTSLSIPELEYQPRSQSRFLPMTLLVSMLEMSSLRLT